jgi:hypothetical protein
VCLGDNSPFIGADRRDEVTMTTLFSDTGPEAEQVLIDLLRDASVTRKLEMLGQMNAAAHQFARQGLRARHPAATDAQLQRHLADLLLGPELAARAYGPLPSEASHAA